MRINCLNYNKAFTLIELAIVLTIIGLIISGVMAGQKLVEVARIRAQIAQMNEFKIGFLSFRNQYDAWPGDMANASEFWSTAISGNGNFMFDNADGNPTFDGNIGNEQLQFFAQLSYAGLIKNSYNGSTTFGVGIPKVSINDNFGLLVGGAYHLNGSVFGQGTHSCSRMSLEVKPYLGLTVSQIIGIPGAGYNDSYGVLSGAQAGAIDTKIDDGLYCYGNFMSYDGSGNCMSAGSYYAAGNSPGCHSYYNMQ